MAFDAGTLPGCAGSAVDILSVAPGAPPMNLHSFRNFGDHWLTVHRVGDLPGAMEFVVTSIDHEGSVIGSATLPRSAMLDAVTQFWPLSVGGTADDFVAMSTTGVVRYRYEAGSVVAYEDGIPIRTSGVWADPAGGRLTALTEVALHEYDWVEIRRDDSAPEGLSWRQVDLRLAGVDLEAILLPGPDGVLAVREHDDHIEFWSMRVSPEGTVTRLPSVVWADPPGAAWPYVRDPSAPRWLFGSLSGRTVDFYALNDADPPTPPVLLGHVVTAADGFTEPMSSFATDAHGTHLFAVNNYLSPVTTFRTLTRDLFRETAGPVLAVLPPADPTDHRFAAILAIDGEAFLRSQTKLLPHPHPNRVPRTQSHRPGRGRGRGRHARQ